MAILKCLYSSHIYVIPNHKYLIKVSLPSIREERTLRITLCSNDSWPKEFIGVDTLVISLSSFLSVSSLAWCTRFCFSKFDN